MSDFQGVPGVRDERRLHEGGSVLWPVKKVFLWLLALTVAEVGIVYLHLPKAALATLLVVGALWKAAIIVLHFMHLRIERRLVTWSLAATTVLAVVYVLLLFPDMVFGPGAGKIAG
jgi:cytochrome c oxidase subunit IV